MIPSTSTTLLRQIGSDAHHARWAEFVARYMPMCRQYLRRHFPSLEADDIMQDTFIALAKALPDYHYAPKERGHFRNYLVGVLRNKALMALRKQKRDEEVLAEFAEETKQDREEGVKAAANNGDWQKAVFEIEYGGGEIRPSEKSGNGVYGIQVGLKIDGKFYTGPDFYGKEIDGVWKIVGE